MDNPPKNRLNDRLHRIDRKMKSNKATPVPTTPSSQQQQKQQIQKTRDTNRKPETKNRLISGTRVGQGEGASSVNDNKRDKRWFQPRNPTNKFNTKSASSPALGSLVDVTKTKERPISIINSGNVTVRRGQPTSSSSSSTNNPQQQNAAQLDDLSRASSLANLNEGSNHQSYQKLKSDNNGTKPKKNYSGAVSARNNNVKESELNVLRKELTKMTAEKADLTQQLVEKDGQVILLRQEVAKLKKLQDHAYFQLEQMGEENSTLRNRLRDVSHSPLSDSEKQQLLFESRHHNSAPASIATNVLDVGNAGGDVTACTTPEWDDKHSEASSVACLQDKIHQMQETNASTNEELQATLQELTDLQTQLTELQQENERLNDDYKLMYDSVCRQNVRLVDSRSEVESLKQLLYRGDAESAAEREEKLVDLLQAARDERDSLLAKLERLESDCEGAKATSMSRFDEIVQLTERVKTLESTVDAKHVEHKRIDRELALVRDSSSNKQIEITRLKDLLENARTKINELEQERDLGDKSELDEMLDNVRKEKDGLESEVAHLKEQLALSRNESDKLKEQVSILQEECKVIRNNAKTTRSDLEYKVEKLTQEKTQLGQQLEQFQEALSELQVQTQYQIDDKRQLGAVLSETQRSLNEAEVRIGDLESQLSEVRKQKLEQESEWERFQNDLLTTVRVANEFKTEAQEDLQRMILENKAERERVKQLEAQIDKLKVTSTTVTTPLTSENLPPLRPSVLNVEELAVRRQKQTLQRQNSRQSVKSLIESIESQAGQPSNKTGCATAIQNLSRSNSMSSVSSMTSDVKTPSSPPSLTDDDRNNAKEVKTPLKEQPTNNLNRDWSRTSLITDSLKGKNEKSLDFARRNSYSDLCDRKDPLNGLVKNGGSKRNALLKWCQNKTVGYRNIDITNFSSSWNDGLALCALLHTYLPGDIPYDNLNASEKRRNFSLAFSAAESVGIPTTLNVDDMIQLERPDWQQVMGYVTAIYRHFET